MAKIFLKNLQNANPKPSLWAVKNLPTMFFFTDRKKIKNIFLVIEKLPENSAVIIREYDLSFEEKEKFARKILEIARLRNLRIFVGKDLKLAKKVRADGVHFSDQDKNLKAYQIPKNMLISYSCHDRRSLKNAKKLKANLVFYSPIFKTNSHPNQKPKGLYLLRNFARCNYIPTYALGGINQSNIKLLGTTKTHGIGGISIFDF